MVSSTIGRWVDVISVRTALRLGGRPGSECAGTDRIGSVSVGGRCRKAYPPLLPWQVRGRRFGTARRGFDPGEVDVFLHRFADDLADLYRLWAEHETPCSHRARR